MKAFECKKSCYDSTSCVYYREGQIYGAVSNLGLAERFFEIVDITRETKMASGKIPKIVTPENMQKLSDEEAKAKKPTVKDALK